MVSTNKCLKNIPWPELQTFLVETTPHNVFDSKEKVGRCPIHIKFLIRRTEAAVGKCFSK